MSRRKKQRTTEETYTQVIPVVSCKDVAQIQEIMQLCGTPRALTYNKLGSLQGWGLDWKRADSIVRTILKPFDIGLPAKLWEWSVSDAMKAITAQQEAAKTLIQRAIYQRTADKDEQLRLFGLMRDNPTKDPWLHRVFRKHYIRGHTFVRNQIVYQNNGYTCKRLTRNTVQLEVAGLSKGKRIQLLLKCRHILTGQIRLLKNEAGQLEVHTIRKRTLVLPSGKPSTSIGIDKGYTEAFYTSDGVKIADGLGAMLSAKTNRITRTNRNRYRLRAHAAALNPKKSALILERNLGYKVKSRRLRREKATIQNFIRRDLRRAIISAVQIFVEDLTQPIKAGQQAKHINRKLNSWIKGELQASIEKIALETGSTVSVVNPAFTSQVDSLSGTLLGSRQGDRFIRYTGDVVQADENAALNVLHRGSDYEITLLMKHVEVRLILLVRTVRYLTSMGKSVTDALLLGWLHPKFRTEALQLEALVSPAGVAGTVKLQ